MNLGDIVLHEIRQPLRTNIIRFYFYEIPRTVIFIQIESRVVVTRGGGKENWGALV